jgi:hypothetical protein
VRGVPEGLPALHEDQRIRWLDPDLVDDTPIFRADE